MNMRLLKTSIISLISVSSLCLIGSGCQKITTQPIQESKLAAETKIDYFEKKKECASYTEKALKQQEDYWATSGDFIASSKMCYSIKYNTCALIFAEKNEKGGQYIIFTNDVLSGEDLPWNEGTFESPGPKAVAPTLLTVSSVMDEAANAVQCAK